MGSHDFQTTASGMNASIAYSNAVDQATYDHGHDGYNGTISTTCGYRMFTDLPESEAPGPILKLIRKDLGLKQSELGELIGRSGGYISKHERGVNPKPLPASEIKALLKAAAYREPYSNYQPWRNNVKEPKLYKAGYTLQDLKNAVNGHLTQSQWADVREAILSDNRFSKRGDCACIQLSENKFAFIGWAAC